MFWVTKWSVSVGSLICGKPFTLKKDKIYIRITSLIVNILRDLEHFDHKCSKIGNSWSSWAIRLRRHCLLQNITCWGTIENLCKLNWTSWLKQEFIHLWRYSLVSKGRYLEVSGGIRSWLEEIIWMLSMELLKDKGPTCSIINLNRRNNRNIFTGTDINSTIGKLIKIRSKEKCGIIRMTGHRSYFSLGLTGWLPEDLCWVLHAWVLRCERTEDTQANSFTYASKRKKQSLFWGGFLDTRLDRALH